MGFFNRNRQRREANEALAQHAQAQAAEQLAKAGLDPALLNANPDEMVRQLMAQADVLGNKAAADGIAAYRAQVDAGVQFSGDVNVGEDPLDALRRLGELRNQGLITEEQFAAEKAKLLGQ